VWLGGRNICHLVCIAVIVDSVMCEHALCIVAKDTLS
jgi:hypothetical protein